MTIIMEIKKLSMQNENEIRDVLRDAFSAPPWNDDWSDEDMFRKYIEDIVGPKNALAFGLYADGKLIGVALGQLKHWFDGTEYCIDDFCVRTDGQSRGNGLRLLVYNQGIRI